MKKNIIATSIIEAMVVLLIVLIGITGSYSMFTNAIRVTDGSANKLMAISMAKEGIEAMTNIRDTNWKVLPGDYKNCWNVLNYNISCFNSNTTINDIPDNTSFIIWKDITDYRWKLTSKPTAGGYANSDYRKDFQVGLTASGFYYQDGTTTTLKPIFTREIQINYLEDGVTAGNQGSDEQKMLVKSIIQWKDSSSAQIRKVELETILSNWKNKVN